MSVGAIIYNGSYAIESFQTDAGVVLGVAETIDEELVTPGVSGRRFRTVYKQTRQFTATTYHAVADYAGAVFLVARIQRMRGENISLTITSGGYTQTFNGDQKLHVIDCRPRIMVGGLVGTGVTTGTHCVSVDWDFVMMEPRPESALP